MQYGKFHRVLAILNAKLHSFGNCKCNMAMFQSVLTILNANLHSLDNSECNMAKIRRVLAIVSAIWLNFTEF